MMPPVRDELLVVESVRIASGGLLLEGELAYPEQDSPWAGAVVSGPHPLLGGTMQNNVVTALTYGLARRGLATLRFNYRGIGQSEGPPVDGMSSLAEFWATSHVTEELAYQEDLVSASAFLGEVLGEGTPLATIGYSFGCSLLPHVAAGTGPLVLIAPTVGTHDYDPFTTLDNPLLLIVSDDDFAANAKQVQQWFDRLRGPRRLERGRFDNHFFRGHEEWLAETVFAFLKEQGSVSPCL
jgi:alpha/beta superfamily hydrolase